MTTITASKFGFSNIITKAMLSGLVAGDVTTANSTTLVVDTSPGPIVTFTGSGVNYSSASGDPVPTSGIVTGVKIQDYPGDAVFTSWSDFSVSATALWSAIETLDVTAFDNLFFSGNDTFIAGGFGDDFEGFGGNDRFIGGAGVNFFEGDAGFDTAQITGPLANYTIVYNNAYHNIVVSDIHGDGVTLTGVESLAFTDVTISTERKTDFSADGDSDFLWQNDSGQAAVWTINGLAQTGGGTVGGNPGPSWHVIAAGDFNNDGHADILWQNDSGQAAIWLMNGVTQIGGAQVGGNPGSAWHVKGTADFNGDGYADILWQNDNGQAAIWLMNGLTQIGGGQVGGNPGPTWHVKGAGDFNGDGRADILWQSDNGQVAIWTMNGLTQTGGATVGGNPGPAWQVMGAGDYNGDGKSDILFQNTSGQSAVWTMNGLTQLGGERDALMLPRRGAIVSGHGGTEEQNSTEITRKVGRPTFQKSQMVPFRSEFAA